VPVWTGCWGASDRTPSDVSDVQNVSLEPLCSAPDAGASASGAALCCVHCMVLQRELSIDRTLAGRQVQHCAASGALCSGVVRFK
jgi:hypothetical protein